jgi:hypothetical protein
MKPKKERPRPSSAAPLETLGGAYHRLESTFQPRPATGERGQGGKRKDVNRDKEKRKTAHSAEA